ncbi:MAG: hypothetical protein UZ11_BCD004001388 [Bacteroidetes bacterium OLB11]|nr:MAG: hypothetical protein UZ11_BCD004001388 [Bacteroidetes bacterium OLB11]
MKRFLLLFIALFLINIGFSQNLKKVHISTCTKIISETEAELTLIAKMDKGWHLYSFNPGGDGMLIAPEVTFEKNNQITPIGKVTEHGKLIDEDIKGVGVVHYFKDEVRYVQKSSI